MKRFLTMLVTMMLLFAVAACGKNENSENSNTENTDKNSTTASTTESVKETDKAENNETTENVTETVAENTELKYAPLEDGNWYYVYPEEGYDYYLIDILDFADKGYDYGMCEKASDTEALGNDIIAYEGAKYHITDFGGEGYGIEYTDNGDTIEVIISGDCHITLSRTADNKLIITKVDEESGFKIGTVYER